MRTEYVATLRDFKVFMTSEAVPCYVCRYWGKLGDEQLERFYNQMIVALELTEAAEYLFYALKWILKSDYDDIAYEMYCHDIMDPECRDETLIKPSRWAECSRKYHKRFVDEYGLSEYFQ
jgi:hypothetical protein